MIVWCFKNKIFINDLSGKANKSWAFLSNFSEIQITSSFSYSLSAELINANEILLYIGVVNLIAILYRWIRKFSPNY